jgi:thymidine phosphorylase
LAQELADVKKTKVETVFIDDSSKPLGHEKGNKIEHQQALKGFGEAMMAAAVHLSVLVNDAPPDVEYIDRWKTALGKASDTLSHFHNILDDIEGNQKTSEGLLP